ncbi:MAG: 30S ribosomal protein S8 [Candidatus Marinimicrobia bacterium]|nr:30S ribosomal protein S8 [Candidatus Neomarinimicrobiota bacterium]
MDPIADMFTIIRNGYAANKASVVVPHSKIKMEVAKLLQIGGYVGEVTRRGRKIKKSLEIVLAYKEGTPAIKKLVRVSKPSRRVYISFKEMFPLSRGYGKRIVSTPKGVLFDTEARKEKVGGEVVGEIW